MCCFRRNDDACQRAKLAKNPCLASVGLILKNAGCFRLWLGHACAWGFGGASIGQQLCAFIIAVVTQHEKPIKLGQRGDLKQRIVFGWIGHDVTLPVMS